MAFAQHDKNVIRSLAARVAEIAALPVQQERRDLWIRLNRLERVRPLIHVHAIDWQIWEELIPDAQLQTTDPVCRDQELALRQRLYCWEHFRDDRVVDDVVACPLAIRNSMWGLSRVLDEPHQSTGAHAFVPVIVDERDIEKIGIDPQVSVNWEETERRYQRLCELYGGTLSVAQRGRDFFWFAPMDQFIQWRGIEQMFVDLLERPQWIHAALERITACYLRSLEQLEQVGALSSGHGNTRLTSGGFAWTDQLPQPDFDGQHVRLKDLWARATTQIFAGVSPEMHEEFALPYERRVLDRFGLGCYGCCEPLDQKMHLVRTIKNVRRVSMSPWVNLERAAAAVGTDYVFTYKPNPAIVSTDQWDPELAREQLRDALERTRHNIVEVNLQDLHTVRHEPHRLTEWTQLALDLAERYA